MGRSSPIGAGSPRTTDPPCQGGCRGFDPRFPLHYSLPLTFGRASEHSVRRALGPPISFGLDVELCVALSKTVGIQFIDVSRRRDVRLVLPIPWASAA